MAALSSSYVLFVALVQNVFYVHRPYNVNSMSVMFETTAAAANNNTWLKMHYDIINDHDLGVFTAPVPSTATQYLRYKVRLHFSDQTVGDTEWRTLLLNITANEEIQLPNNNNNNNA